MRSSGQRSSVWKQLHRKNAHAICGAEIARASLQLKTAYFFRDRLKKNLLLILDLCQVQIYGDQESLTAQGPAGWHVTAQAASEHSFVWAGLAILLPGLKLSGEKGFKRLSQTSAAGSLSKSIFLYVTTVQGCFPILCCFSSGRAVANHWGTWNSSHPLFQVKM